MKLIHSYLSFNGNCREAMLFYKKCLGGELNFQTIGESPGSTRLPNNMKKCILHSTLKNDRLVLMGTDITSENGLLRGNAVSMLLDCASEKEIKSCYKRLSAGGQPTQPLEKNSSGITWGGVRDRFGNYWLLCHSFI